MSLRKSLFIFVLLINFAQGKEVSTLAFYNVENMFDHIDDPLTNDKEFTPSGRKRWTKNIADKKINNIAEVISKIKSTEASAGPTVLGLAEVENAKVLDQLVSNNQLSSSRYAYVHVDSPDRRGIDVAFLYKPELFELISFKTYKLDIPSNPTYKTRDQLLVTGLLGGEKLHFIINHWPSRSGGERRSRPFRIAAANLTKKIITEISTNEANPKVVIMGDFNDNPRNKSLRTVLGAKLNRGALQDNDIFNPFQEKVRKGIGTNAYRDAWFNFDQILLTNSLINNLGSEWSLYRAVVFNQNFLIQKSGLYRGYPKRTFNGTSGIGYSDHFPVLTYLIRQ